MHQAKMQKFCIRETGYKTPKIDCMHQAKMQKFCIRETGYKTPKIDCIKLHLRCKNSASDKLDKKYLKSTASSYSLVGKLLSLLVPSMLVYTIW